MQSDGLLLSEAMLLLASLKYPLATGHSICSESALSVYLVLLLLHFDIHFISHQKHSMVCSLLHKAAAADAHVRIAFLWLL